MDIYKEVTDRIVAEMEKGIIPWEKPWIASGNCVAHTTGKPYSLLNQMLLLQCLPHRPVRRDQRQAHKNPSYA